MMFAGVMLYSCDRDELFEREQYKHVISLLGEEDNGFNIFVEEHNLAALPASQGYVSVICGGSLPTDRDVKVTVTEDEELLSTYNIANTAVSTVDENDTLIIDAITGDTTLRDTIKRPYAQRLPYGNYDIASYNITIPAGERVGLLDIKVRPTGLSPDSVYLLPLSVKRFSTYEVNPKKTTLLYRVYMKNFYATNKSDVYYNARLTSPGSPTILDYKLVRPIGGNSVRVMAGTGLTSSLDMGGMLLTVDENNKVRIQPWKNLDITQIDGDPEYPNDFLIYNDGYKKYKTFRLYYSIVIGGEKFTCQEELKIEYDEKKEKQTL
jgi:hypothetical protein